ncbi:Anion exchange transporter [Myotis davidii]|uniref:Anion exchange transporter n=1 Tax=Myotis davidii TaxID=225400 RepID=L5M1G7_MYODS|nr:Anion exchange transporter [Myotis davidii]
MGRTSGLYSTGAKTQGIWVSTYVFTICFAANVGLLFGVVCTIAMVIGRFPRAKTLNIKNMNEMEFKMKTEMDDETRQQVKIISINNPLVFLNAKKFHADLMNIIQKEHASNQPFDDTNKCEQNSLLNSLSNGNCIEEASQPRPEERTCSVVLDCSGLALFDSSGVSVLVEVWTRCVWTENFLSLQ